MRILNTLRVVLAGVLLILGALTIEAKENKDSNKAFELKKKAIYYEIQAQLASDEITLKEAQRLWKKKVKHLKKEEGR